MKKLILILILLSTPAFASCGEWNRTLIPISKYCKSGWVEICIGGEWQWVCF